MAWSLPRALTASIMASVLLGSCHPAVRSETTPTTSALNLQYEVALDSDLREAEVQLCMDGPMPARLLPGTKGGADKPINATAIVDQRRVPLLVDDVGISLAGVPEHSCVAYRVALPEPQRNEGDRPWQVIDTGQLLWRPEPRAWKAGVTGTLALRIPVGMVASAPFPTQPDGRYRLDLSAFRYMSRMAIGQFRETSFERAGCDVHVALLPGLPPQVEAALLDHLREAVTATASVLGTFPATQLQVIAVAAGPGGGQPVRFGQMVRGGGASVVLLMSTDADPEKLSHDWTTVHELSHLLLPFVDRDDCWLSEGMATYYQEVLRARAGLVPPEVAIRRLLDGAALGLHATDPLAVESQQMMLHRSFRKVYWGGATFAMQVDIELRRRSGGTTSLDSVLRLLHKQLTFQAPKVTARELLRILDGLAGMPVFSELAQAQVYQVPATAALPDKVELGRILRARPESPSRDQSQAGAKAAPTL